MYLDIHKANKARILSCYNDNNTIEKGRQKESSLVADMHIPDDPEAAEKYKVAYDAYMDDERKKCKEEGTEFDIEQTHGKAHLKASEAAVK